MAESATPQEVIAKVKEAAVFLEKAGAGGVKDFTGKGTKWAWKDTYVFVFNCEADQVAGHISEKLVGNAISELVDKKDNLLGLEICAAAEDPKGGWTEYWWPKAGKDVPQRKVSYALKVKGQPFEVSAGIYDENKSLDELKAMIK